MTDALIPNGHWQADFTGMNVLVTGASSGIGEGIARALLAAGANVYAAARRPQALNELAEHPRCSPVLLDIADADALPAALQELPVMDALVNSAGVTSLEPADALSATALTQVFDTNVRGSALVSSLIVGRMLQAGKTGAVVHLSSQASLVGLHGHASYCASKGALDALMRVQCLEWGRHGIRVNCVNPTVTLTPMAEQAWSAPEKRDPMLAGIPLGRFARVEDVVAPVLFLLSGAAHMITGVALPVDGGFTAV
ncbi:SDR family oxidoreductase [Pokkaliibacter sp. CJK22405]|uniref:SDR family oxidoreductase n=1 Tax=Pokkaliibacter sp. CJK22405 TaxID=3384615 RepID=UPI0039853361